MKSLNVGYNISMKKSCFLFFMVWTICFWNLGGKLLAIQKEETVSAGEIQYVLEGGSNSILNPSKITDEMLPLELSNPAKTGYLFGGWYLDPEYSKRVYRITDTAGCRLYAKWNLQILPNRNVQEYPYRGLEDTILLRDLSYNFLYELDTPGNPDTRIKDLLQQKYASEYQCPQGLCITPDYYIVSSYALESDKLGALTLYDRNTCQYVVSFGMEADSHLGGIAYDGENIWICHSSTREIERISYDFIKRLAQVSSQNFIDITHCFARYPVKNTPSAIACFDGDVFVATHRIYTPGVMYHYRLENERLVAEEKCILPSKVQGICKDSENRIWLSLSYGRNQSSYLYVYESYEELKKHFMEPERKIELLPGSEAVVVDSKMCYVLFETASYKYYEGSDGKGSCNYPLDKILYINCDGIFYD